MEDAIHGRQRAKVEIYDTSVFVVLKPLRYVEQTSDIETGELMCFVGDHFIVTVRRGEASPLAGLRHRLEADPAPARLGPMAVLHGIVDGVVDNYTAIDAEVSSDLDDIETAVFSGADMDSSTIYRLKREVLEFRRATVPLAAPLMALHEDDNPHVDRPRAAPAASATCPTTCRPSSTTSSRTTGCSPTCSAPTWRR